MRFKLLIHGACEIVQITKNGDQFLIKDRMRQIQILRKTDQIHGYSIVVDEKGRIAAIGSDENIQKSFGHEKFDQVIDASDLVVLPGLIDAHTHPVWAGDRVHEFAMKLAGASYMDVHKSGGGINFTVHHTREASELELLKWLENLAMCMLKSGTTCIEAKSGYGLDAENELKMLRVLKLAKQRLPLEISCTFCGAHSVPKGKTSEEATRNVIDEQLPAIKEACEKGEIDVENIDVFCEEGVFNVDQTRRILESGQACGLAANFHGDELHPMASAELAASVKARAISHVEKISDQGIIDLANSGTVAVLLPTTAYVLRLDPPPVRKMIEAGVPIALGSDFNPNAYCYSMPMVMNLACVLFHMTLEEALVAATLNAAASLGRSHTHGALNVGFVADMLIIDAPRWEHLIYQFGCHDKLIKYVVKNGHVVYKKPRNGSSVSADQDD